MPKVGLTLSIDARQAAAFIDARFDLVFPNSERVVIRKLSLSATAQAHGEGGVVGNFVERPGDCLNCHYRPAASQVAYQFPSVAYSDRRSVRALPSKENPCDGAGRRRSGRRLPRLEPWAHAVFQLGDCARRDAFVIRVCSGDIVRETMRCGSTLHLSSPRPCRLGVCDGRSTQTADTRVSTGLLRLEFERFRDGYSITDTDCPPGTV